MVTDLAFCLQTSTAYVSVQLRGRFSLVERPKVTGKLLYIATHMYIVVVIRKRRTYFITVKKTRRFCMTTTILCILYISFVNKTLKRMVTNLRNGDFEILLF